MQIAFCPMLNPAPNENCKVDRRDGWCVGKIGQITR